MRWFYYFSKYSARLLFRLVFRLKICGLENIPAQGGFILASNHVSLYDPPLVGGTVPRRVHFLAKRELFQNPILGFIIRNLNSHPIRRGVFDKRIVEMVRGFIDAGEPVIIFPEGHRSPDGNFLPPRPGVAIMARTCRTSVIPAYISGSNRLWNCFWGKERLAIIFGQPLDKNEVIKYDEAKEGYRRLAEDIMDRIRGLKTEWERRK